MRDKTDAVHAEKSPVNKRIHVERDERRVTVQQPQGEMR